MKETCIMKLLVALSPDLCLYCQYLIMYSLRFHTSVNSHIWWKEWRNVGSTLFSPRSRLPPFIYAFPRRRRNRGRCQAPPPPPRQSRVEAARAKRNKHNRITPTHLRTLAPCPSAAATKGRRRPMTTEGGGPTADGAAERRSGENRGGGKGRGRKEVTLSCRRPFSLSLWLS